MAVDNTLLVAVLGGCVAQFVVGIFNNLTMRTRTQADIRSAMINAQVVGDKNVNDAEQALINQWIAAYKVQGEELKTAKEEIKELKAELKQLAAGATFIKAEVVQPVVAKVRDVEL